MPMRELQAVIDAAPEGQWCWAAQAADAQRDMKRLAEASLAIDATPGHVDQDKLAAAHLRSAGAVRQQRRRTRSQDGQAADQDLRLHAVHGGAQNFCAIRSYLATAAKHGIGMPGALTRAAPGAAWAPGTA